MQSGLAAPSLGIQPYHAPVPSYYTIDRANERLPELRTVLERLRDERLQLIHLRDLAVERMTAVEAGRSEDAGTTGRGPGSGTDMDATSDDELRRLRLRMQGLIDQMQAAVGEIDGWGITLRDIATGLVDFPALVNGRPVWLCWRLGDAEVAWWHEYDAGFASRRPFADLA